MKKTPYQFMPALVALVLLGSCDLGLEQANPNGSLSDGYWNSLSRIDGTLTAAYNGLLHHGVASLATESSRADISYPDRRGNPENSFYVPFYEHQIASSNRELADQWEGLYKIIFRANQTIEALEGLKASAETEEWTRIMGEARFLRGLAHFYLHTRFNKGEIVIRDYLPKSAGDFNKPLSSSEETIAFFRADLWYAYDNLKPKSQIDEGAYRASSGAAATVLGTSYLYEQQYDSAMIMFDDVINNTRYAHGYGLAPADIMFNFSGENNVESIFEVSYSTELSPEKDRFDEESLQHRLARQTAPPYANGGVEGGNHQFFPAAWLAYAYANEPIDTLDPRNTVNGHRRTVSLRASAMVALVQDTITPYYLQDFAARRISFGQFNFCFFKKYTSHDIVATEGDTGNDPFRGGKNVILHRFADVLLMQAECLLKSGGDVEGALALINRVRSRWGLRLLGPDGGDGKVYDKEAYTVATLMDHLMYVERPLELAAEGSAIRSADLRRWGIYQKRLQDLSVETYHLEHFSYIDAEGLPAFRFHCYLNKGSSPSPGDPVIHQLEPEYKTSYGNFQPGINEYLPIPASEILANSGI